MIRQKGQEPIREAVRRLDQKLWHQLEEVWRKAEEGIQDAQRSKDGHQQGTKHCLAVEENLSALIPDECVESIKFVPPTVQSDRTPYSGKDNWMGVSDGGGGSSRPVMLVTVNPLTGRRQITWPSLAS
jgi:hypothetical protein